MKDKNVSNLTNIIRTNIAFDFENEIESVFRLFDADKIIKK